MASTRMASTWQEIAEKIIQERKEAASQRQEVEYLRRQVDGLKKKVYEMSKELDSRDGDIISSAYLG